LGLILSVLLALLGVAVFPCWRHSAGWGYAPSLAAGFLLTLLAAMTMGGRPLTDDARIARIKVPLGSTQELADANAKQEIQAIAVGPP
jgi:hypothetical protein